MSATELSRPSRATGRRRAAAVRARSRSRSPASSARCHRGGVNMPRQGSRAAASSAGTSRDVAVDRVARPSMGEKAGCSRLGTIGACQHQRRESRRRRRRHGSADGDHHAARARASSMSSGGRADGHVGSTMTCRDHAPSRATARGARQLRPDDRTVLLEHRNQHHPERPSSIRGRLEPRRSRPVRAGHVPASRREGRPTFGRPVRHGDLRPRREDRTWAAVTASPPAAALNVVSAYPTSRAIAATSAPRSPMPTGVATVPSGSRLGAMVPRRHRPRPTRHTVRLLRAVSLRPVACDNRPTMHARRTVRRPGDQPGRFPPHVAGLPRRRARSVRRLRNAGPAGLTTPSSPRRPAARRRRSRPGPGPPTRTTSPTSMATA